MPKEVDLDADSDAGSDDSEGELASMQMADRSLNKQLERLLGSEPTAVSQKAFTKLAKAMSSLDLPDEKGDKPMSLASQNGNTEMVKLLSKLGANVNERDADGDTPFSVAAVNEVSTPNLEPLPSPSPPSLPTPSRMVALSLM